MILIIGGMAQGKLEYVKNNYGIEDKDIFNPDDNCDIFEIGNYKASSDRIIVLNNFNNYIVSCRDKSNDDFDLVDRFIKKYPNAIIITDEVGNGIVPVDKNERLLRERIGRIQCALAEKADEVIRVVCGIGQKIKPDNFRYG
ncbi:MAG: bifunctional adenosylcobinamide kinase/adenosylcobinamide-phosphate guanylyltransferase [Lachnospiraceae bacterium]|nr:bifunctional adenosylcobinamide kinase/adenosylcobinamide-phosphate guanylyltransferase [Lachnospiraceae bacterium]